MTTLSLNESNPYTILLQKMKLFFLSESTNPLDRVREARRLLSFIERIFRSPATGEVFLYLLDRGATTAWLLQVDLEIPEATAYRTLKRLRALGLLTQAWKIPNSKECRGGPRPKIWALLGATTEEVARAARDHHRALTPHYRVAEEFVQYLLEECIHDDISYKQIIQEARNKLEMPRQTIISVSQLASTILKEKGIKVWH